MLRRERVTSVRSRSNLVHGRSVPIFRTDLRVINNDFKRQPRIRRGQIDTIDQAMEKWLWRTELTFSRSIRERLSRTWEREPVERARFLKLILSSKFSVDRVSFRWIYFSRSSGFVARKNSPFARHFRGLQTKMTIYRRENY